MYEVPKAFNIHPPNCSPERKAKKERIKSLVFIILKLNDLLVCYVGGNQKLSVCREASSTLNTPSHGTGFRNPIMACFAVLAEVDQAVSFAPKRIAFQ